MSARPAVLHRDHHLLVVEKPPGISTTSPDAGEVTLASLAREIDPDAPRMHPTSRLDRDVSGVVVFARTELATRALLEARAEGRYRRSYLAIVSGEPPERGEWTWSIAIDPRDRAGRVALDPGAHGEREQEARTAFERSAVAAGCALLALRPVTGRTHQLRVHCAKAGWPILGDSRYGGAPRVVLPDGRVVAARRTMLHCASVSVPDPIRCDVDLDLRCPPPDDFARVWTGLGGAILSA